MGIGAIRLAARTVLDGVPSLNEVLARPPDNVAVVPCAWLGDATATVAMGQLEVWTWTLPLTVVVARKSVYAMEQEATEALLDGIMTAIRSNFTLAGTTYGVVVTALREGQVTVAGTEYVGFSLTLSIKEKAATSLEG
jgi:hypothetical protein